MTVCIAAVASRDRIVCAADQMLVLHGVDRYEPDIAKFYPLGRSIVALFADDATLAAKIVGELITEFSATYGAPWKLDLTVAQIAERYCEAYAAMKKRRFENVINPFGLTLVEFQDPKKKLRRSIEDEIWQRIDDVEHEMDGSCAIIAGVDRGGGPDLYVLDNEIATPMRSPGFACIGIGDNHARTELIARGYNISRSQGEVMLMALAAKRRAQLATGVGDKTHICVCGPESDALRLLTHVDDGTLAALYNDWQRTDKDAFDIARVIAERTYADDDQFHLMLPIEQPTNQPAPQSPPVSKDDQ
jgi:20S proteasome alpha/beta subunit